jgi:ferredoxin
MHEAMAMNKGKMKVNKDMCMYCGACVGTCPDNAIYLDETRIVFSECRQCLLCERVCPVGAIDKDEREAK